MCCENNFTLIICWAIVLTKPFVAIFNNWETVEIRQVGFVDNVRSIWTMTKMILECGQDLRHCLD